MRLTKSGIALGAKARAGQLVPTALGSLAQEERKQSSRSLFPKLENHFNHYCRLLRARGGEDRGACLGLNFL